MIKHKRNKLNLSAETISVLGQAQVRGGVNPSFGSFRPNTCFAQDCDGGSGGATATVYCTHPTIDCAPP